jgi:hypothetical protein
VLGHLGDRIDTLLNVVPIALEAGRTRKDAIHADYRNRFHG